MKIQVMSDLHLEFYGDPMKFIDELPIRANILVLAGDIMSFKMFPYLRAFCQRWKHVLYVPGNHEYYDYHLNPRNSSLRELIGISVQEPNFDLLYRDVRIIEGVRFLGATLWFPETGDPSEEIYRNQMNDFRLIKDAVPWIGYEHNFDHAFLENNIQKGDVVITHHLPHPESINERYEGSPLNRYFCSEDAAHLVESRHAQLWIHGHTHTACDYKIQGTRVVCNPAGYPGDLSTFTPDFTVDVSPVKV